MKTLLNSALALLFLMLLTLGAAAQIISGKVLYQDDPKKPLGNVTVILTNVNTHTSFTQVTDKEGTYLFEDLPNGTYELSGAAQLNTEKSVTIEDAELVRQYLAGELQLTPMQLLAADVNGSGNVTNGDYQLIKNNIVKYHTFPVGDWRFETKTFVLPVPRISEGLPQGIGGMCSGDVGGSWIPIARSSKAIPMTCSGEQYSEAGSSFSMAITTGNELTVSAAGLVINYPAGTMEITSVGFDGQGYDYVIDGNQIRLVWDDMDSQPLHFAANSSIITINGKLVAQPGKDAAMLSIDGSSCMIDAVTRKAASLQLSSPVLKIAGPVLTLSSYPNPCTSSARLSISNPTEGMASIELYDAAGKLVKALPASNLAAGNQEINIATSGLAAGKYICKVRVLGAKSELVRSIQLLKTE